MDYKSNYKLLLAKGPKLQKKMTGKMIVGSLIEKQKLAASFPHMYNYWKIKIGQQKHKSILNLMGLNGRFFLFNNKSLKVHAKNLVGENNFESGRRFFSLNDI